MRLSASQSPSSAANHEGGTRPAAHSASWRVELRARSIAVFAAEVSPAIPVAISRASRSAHRATCTSRRRNTSRSETNAESASRIAAKKASVFGSRAVRPAPATSSTLNARSICATAAERRERRSARCALSATPKEARPPITAPSRPLTNPAQSNIPQYRLSFRSCHVRL